MEKPFTRRAFTYQLFGRPQVTTRSGFIEREKKKIAEANIAFADRSDGAGLACLASVVGTYLLA